MNETTYRLREIQEEILNLLGEASDLIESENPGAYSRAKAYWLAHATMAVTKDHSYLGGSMCDMDDTINELEEDEVDDTSDCYPTH